MRTRFLAAVLLATALTAAAPLTALPAYADPSAPVPAFTWSGAAEAATGDARISTGGNWAGGVAPGAGQPVALAFPPLACVAVATCGRVVNDVAGLVAESLAITEPATAPPGPYVVQGGYELSGTTLGLGASLTAASEARPGSSVRPIVWGVPVDIAAQGSSWRLTDTELLLRAGVGGGNLSVLTTRASLSIEPGVLVHPAFFTLRSADQTFASSVSGARVDAPVRAHDVYLSVAAARLGPLTTRKSTLALTDLRPLIRRPLQTVIVGDLQLDHKTLLVAAGFTRKHPYLHVRGRAFLAAVRLDTHLDCSAMTPGIPLTLVHAQSIWGNLSRPNGTRIANHSTIRPTTSSGCPSGVRLRVDYTPRDVLLTVLAHR